MNVGNFILLSLSVLQCINRSFYRSNQHRSAHLANHDVKFISGRLAVHEIIGIGGFESFEGFAQTICCAYIKSLGRDEC